MILNNLSPHLTYVHRPVTIKNLPIRESALMIRGPSDDLEFLSRSYAAVMTRSMYPLHSQATHPLGVGGVSAGACVRRGITDCKGIGKKVK